MLERGKIRSMGFNRNVETIKERDLAISKRITIEWIVDNDVDFYLLAYLNYS